MKAQSHLWIEESRIDDGQIVAESIIECPGFGSQRLWFSLPEEHGPALSRSCDPFVLGALFVAMRSGHPLHVHGEVSPSLLRNLCEFQGAWQGWFPHRYQRIDILCDREQEHPKAESRLNLATFSGGVDSCFTARRHSRPNAGQHFRQLQAVIMVHGFDVPLEEKRQFELSVENSRKILRNTPVELIPVATNYKDLGSYWGDAHGAGLAFSLMMLQGRYTAGLIASSVTYNDLFLPWGSNPVTDILMSSSSFAVVHDGSDFSRNEKVKSISTWPDAMQYLRVCWEGEQRDQNCGVCSKCIRTMLNFRVMGAGLPASFKRDVTTHQILQMRGLCAEELYDLNKIYQLGKTSWPTDPWVKALGKTIRLNRMINYRNALWTRIRGGARRRCKAIWSHDSVPMSHSDPEEREV